MTDRERAEQRTEIQTAFENGSVFDADEKTLLTYLKSLCSLDVPNESVRHRELLRGITIHYIQTARSLCWRRETRKLNSGLCFWQLAAYWSERLRWLWALYGILDFGAAEVLTPRAFPDPHRSRPLSAVANSQSPVRIRCSHCRKSPLNSRLSAARNVEIMQRSICFPSFPA